MNRYPAWKYILLIVVISFGLLYALPNLHGDDPAVQVSSARGFDLVPQRRRPQILGRDLLRPFVGNLPDLEREDQHLEERVEGHEPGAVLAVAPREVVPDDDQVGRQMEERLAFVPIDVGTELENLLAPRHT